MAHAHTTCNAVGGRIRTSCPRCGRTAFIEIAPETRRKIVRCACGKSSTYQINYRRSTRSPASIRASALLGSRGEAKIRVCDTSEEGIGFTVPGEFQMSLHRGDQIRISYRSGGSLAQRTLLVRSINGNRIGGQYT